VALPFCAVSGEADFIEAFPEALLAAWISDHMVHTLHNVLSYFLLASFLLCHIRDRGFTRSRSIIVQRGPRPVGWW
jgi:hypothetical protein